ncbi:ROK family protein [Echinicola shivajiensis]|uniref:ROK family protein n=1 Tax=Echinicola shivajiensis TaxID=1035916 RepID=UPI001BFC20D5|nr:ROK family protein [Echinicola shivajiensis]
MNIGVDLGGTKIQVGLENNGIISNQTKALLTNKDSLSSTLDQVKTLIHPFVNSDVTGIGIGVPSVVDTEKGIVYNVTNIPSWEKVNLKDILEAEFKLPVKVNNDVNCFVLGEHQFGQAKGFSSVVGMSAGTGLGAGLIMNNQLLTGHNCGAGEIGLLPYLDQNIEYYASGNFFSTFHGTSALLAFEAAQKGDPQALAQWQEFGKHFGKAVTCVLYGYDPEAIVIGGSLSKAFSFFEESMYESLKDFIFPKSLNRLQIKVSNNENIALLGAAALINQKPHN